MSHVFRKRPVEVQAFQMTFERRQDNVDWPEWLHEAWNKEDGEEGRIYPQEWPHSDGTDLLQITTARGEVLVRWNDYIVLTGMGELCTFNPAIFESSFEQVELV